MSNPRLASLVMALVISLIPGLALQLVEAYWAGRGHPYLWLPT